MTMQLMLNSPMFGSTMDFTTGYNLSIAKSQLTLHFKEKGLEIWNYLLKMQPQMSKFITLKAIAYGKEGNNEYLNICLKRAVRLDVPDLLVDLLKRFYAHLFDKGILVAEMKISDQEQKLSRLDNDCPFDVKEKKFDKADKVPENLEINPLNMQIKHEDFRLLEGEKIYS